MTCVDCQYGFHGYCVDLFCDCGLQHPEPTRNYTLTPPRKPYLRGRPVDDLELP